MRYFLLLLLFSSTLVAQAQDSATLRRLSDEIMLHGTCYENLRTLCKSIGHRLSGSPEAEKAVAWAAKALAEAGADRVWLQPADVPIWIRGKESLKLSTGKHNTYEEVHMLSLGNSVGTNGKLLDAPIVMFNNLAAFQKADPESIRGRIVFFNYRFREDLINTFEGYADAGPYRWVSANWASSKGAVGVIIRSVSTGVDDAPHTGSMKYGDTIKPIPAVAIGNFTADKLEKKCSKGIVHAQLQSECHMLDSLAHSYNVIGEIRGTKYPNEIIVAGGHLDSWDVGEGAQDDGAGCVQSIEVIRTLKSLNIRPKRTVRAVLFMNEENGLHGGVAYADSAVAKKEHHILAIESDAGGYSPRGFGLNMTAAKKMKLQQYSQLFLDYGVYDFSHDEGGADITPLYKTGVPAVGLMPDAQRYFDMHHSTNDVFEAVSHRELKLGAFAMTALVYLVSEYGL